MRLHRTSATLDPFWEVDVPFSNHHIIHQIRMYGSAFFYLDPTLPPNSPLPPDAISPLEVSITSISPCQPAAYLIVKTFHFINPLAMPPDSSTSPEHSLEFMLLKVSLKGLEGSRRMSQLHVRMSNDQKEQH